MVTIHKFSTLYLNKDFMSKLYNENMKMFAASQRNPTRLALCKIVSREKSSSSMLISMIETSIYSHTKQKDDSVPHHMLSSIIHEDIETLVSLLTTLESTIIESGDAKSYEIYYECLNALVRILIYSIALSGKSAPIASELTANCLQKIHGLLKVGSEEDLLAMVRNDSELDPSKKLKLASAGKYLKGENAKKFMKELKKKSKVSLNPDIEGILKIGKITKGDNKLTQSQPDDASFENLEYIMQ